MNIDAKIVSKVFTSQIHEYIKIIHGDEVCFIQQVQINECNISLECTQSQKL